MSTKREWRMLDEDYHFTRWLPEDYVLARGMGGNIRLRLSASGDILEVESGHRTWQEAPFSEGTFEVRDVPSEDIEVALRSDAPHAVTEGMAAFDAAARMAREEILRAIRKHGIRRTPLSTDPTDAAMKLAVLVEEVGEVASALTYDRGDRENLKAELIQVAAMALAWAASIV